MRLLSPNRLALSPLTLKCLSSGLLVALFLITIMTLPVLDSSEPNVFFYLQHLTPLYYICLISSLALAIISGKGLMSILSAIIFSLLLLWTPSIMLFQSWPMDIYPFLSQAVNVARNGSIGTAGPLFETPTLGIFFGSLLVLTGINPLFIVEVYPVLFVVIFVILTYLVAREAGVKTHPIIAPLLSVASMWPNEIHFSRQCFSLIFYVVAVYLLLRLIKKRDSAVLVVLLFQIVTLTLSHPGSPLFFIAAASGILVSGFILRRIRLKDVRLLVNVNFLSIVTWLIWNAYSLPQSKGLRVLVGVSQRAISSLLGTPGEVSGVAKILVGYTSTYSTIISIRLALTLSVSIGGILLSIVIFKHYQLQKAALFVLSFLAISIFSGVFLLYAGLPFMSRPALFTFIAWGPVGAIAYKLVEKARIVKIVIVIAFIALPSLLLPITKYSPIPFTFATTQELTSTTFINSNLNGSEYLYLEQSPPYGYSYIINKNEATNFPLTMYNWYVPEKGFKQSVLEDYPTLATPRLVNRDAFWEYDPSMLEMMSKLTSYENQLNKIYDSGWACYIFIPLQYHSEEP